MRVGVVTSSKNIALALKKNLVLILAISILYAINSFAIGEIKLVPGTAGGGELRPFIFIPAVAAIFFGPLVGSFSAGLGNILIDVVNDVLLENDTLGLSNLAGFLGNFIGAWVVGVLAYKLKFDKDDKVLLHWKPWLRFLQNSLAAIVGLGLVTGEVIGLLLGAFGKVPNMFVAHEISASIFYYNSLFLIITILPLQIVFGLYEKIRAKRFSKAIYESRNVTVVEEPEQTPAIIESFKIQPGTAEGGLVKGEWVQIKMAIRNNLTIPMAFRMEINCEDRVEPSVAYTKELQPNEVDEKFFQVNPFNDSDRVFTIYLKNWSETYQELSGVSRIGMSVRYRFTYKALTPFEHHFNAFTKLLAICAFVVLIFNSVQTIYGTSGLTSLNESKYFIWAMIVCGIELLALLGLYIYKLITVKKRIEKAQQRLKEERWQKKKEQEEKLKDYEKELQKMSDQLGLEVATEEPVEEPFKEISEPRPSIIPAEPEAASEITTEPEITAEPVVVEDEEATPTILTEIKEDEQVQETSDEDRQTPETTMDQEQPSETMGTTTVEEVSDEQLDDNDIQETRQDETVSEELQETEALDEEPKQEDTRKPTFLTQIQPEIREKETEEDEEEES